MEPRWLLAFFWLSVRFASARPSPILLPDVKSHDFPDSKALSGPPAATGLAALPLAHMSSLRCSQKLIAGGGASRNDAGGGVSSAQEAVSLSCLPDSALATSLTPFCEVCDCLSHVVSDEPFSIVEASSSFGSVDVEAVPYPGDEAGGVLVASDSGVEVV